MNDRVIIATTIMKTEQQAFLADVKKSGLTTSEYIRQKLGYTVSATRGRRSNAKK